MNDGPDTKNHREMLCGNVATTIGSRLKSGALDCDRKEVEVIEQSSKTALAWPRERSKSGIPFLRYFFQRLHARIRNDMDK
jgi:hypothetical protein